MVVDDVDVAVAVVVVIVWLNMSQSFPYMWMPMTQYPHRWSINNGTTNVICVVM
jgi:hypothetical protein